MEKINLLIIEDNRMLREGITAMIEKESDLAMMAALGWNETTLTKVSDSKPDVLLLGFSLANQDSFELLQSVKMNSPETKVIVIDIVPLQSHIVPFIRAGVSGFLLKDASTDDFLSTIRSVSAGEKVLPLNLTESLFSQIVNQTVTEKISRRFEAVRLTQREHQIIDCVSEGITNKEIADKLCISVYTVKSHIHNILEKLALHSRVQIANYSFNTNKASDIANIAKNNSPENE